MFFFFQKYISLKISSSSSNFIEDTYLPRLLCDCDELLCDCPHSVKNKISKQLSSEAANLDDTLTFKISSSNNSSSSEGPENSGPENLKNSEGPENSGSEDLENLRLLRKFRREEKKDMTQLVNEMENLNQTVTQLAEQVETLQGNYGEEKVTKMVGDLFIKSFPGNLFAEDFGSWIERFIVICDARGIEPERRCKMLPAYLTDRAKDSYKNLTQEIRDTDNFELLVRELNKALASPELAMFHEATLYRPQGQLETVGEYLKFLQRALKQAFADEPAETRDRLLLGRMLNGLKG